MLVAASCRRFRVHGRTALAGLLMSLTSQLNMKAAPSG